MRYPAKVKNGLLLIMNLFLPILAVSVVFANGVMNSVPAIAAGGTWTGNGTEDNPYLIVDEIDLAKLATDVNGGRSYENTFFKLTVDIDLMSVAAGNNWIPIGTSTNSFCGSFDGDGHTISNLAIARASMSNVGLFGCIDNGVIKNLGIISGDIQGYSQVGSVVGFNYVGTVENCYSANNVNSTGIVGGVVGYNYYGTVIDCYNTGKVDGTIGNVIGGVVGLNGAGEIINCYNTGTVNSGSIYSGGIAGFNYYGTVENCYNTGAVKGTNVVGGVVGYNTNYISAEISAGYNSANIKNCYNTGAVSGAESIGGIVGINHEAVTNCYNTGTVSGYFNVGGVVGTNYFGSATNCYYNNDNYTGTGIGADAATTAAGKTTAEMTTPGFAATIGSAFEKRDTDDDYCYYPELKVFSISGSAMAQDASKTSTVVARRSPILISFPATTSITYGQALNTSTLSGGIATDPISGTNVIGIFAWVNGEFTYPTVSDGNHADFSYVFTATTYQDLYKPVTSTAKITINKAILTVTADNQFKKYGDDNPPLAIQYSGFVNGNTPASIITMPSPATVVTNNSPAGTYPITISGGIADNYDFIYAPATLTVTKAMLTILADNTSRAYSDDNPPLTFQYSGFVNGEDAGILIAQPSIFTEAGKNSSAGVYPIIISGGMADNYNFTYIPGTLTVDKVTLTVTANDASKTQNKDNPSLTYQFSGFVNGEDERVLIAQPVAYTNAEKNSPVGTFPIDVSGGVADNYHFIYVAGTLTIQSGFPGTILWATLCIVALLVVIVVATLLIKHRWKS
ncbi:MAG: hypothetical protein FWH51_02465 [Dehalococcoidia bacterium]|nr:hypothetical protein [Dehalococcoidia bacterium]